MSQPHPLASSCLPHWLDLARLLGSHQYNVLWSVARWDGDPLVSTLPPHTRPPRPTQHYSGAEFTGAALIDLQTHHLYQWPPCVCGVGFSPTPGHAQFISRIVQSGRGLRTEQHLSISLLITMIAGPSPQRNESSPHCVGAKLLPPGDHCFSGSSLIGRQTLSDLRPPPVAVGNGNCYGLYYTSTKYWSGISCHGNSLCSDKVSIKISRN